MEITLSIAYTKIKSKWSHLAHGLKTLVVKIFSALSSSQIQLQICFANKIVLLKKNKKQKQTHATQETNKKETLSGKL